MTDFLIAGLAFFSGVAAGSGLVFLYRELSGR